MNSLTPDQVNAQRHALSMFRCAHTRETETLVRDNCGACALRGHGAYPTEEGHLAPNYAGWVRVYIQAGRPFGRYVMAAGHILGFNETPYGDAARADFQAYGPPG